MANGVLASMSNGGSCICVKFDVISSCIMEMIQRNEVNLYTLLKVIDAAKEDGQNMEIALKRKNEKIEELEKKLEETERERKEYVSRYMETDGELSYSEDLVEKLGIELRGTKEELEETKKELQEAKRDYNRLERESNNGRWSSEPGY